MKLEAKCALNVDRINETLTRKEYKETEKIIKETKALSKQLENYNKDNAAGFMYLCEAYGDLTDVLSGLSGGENKDQGQLRTHLLNSLANLQRAEVSFSNYTFRNFSTTLKSSVQELNDYLKS